MSKKNSKKKQNSHNAYNPDERSQSAKNRERMKKAVVWTFVLIVIVGLVLSMSPDPSALTNLTPAS